MVDEVGGMVGVLACTALEREPYEAQTILQRRTRALHGTWLRVLNYDASRYQVRYLGTGYCGA